MLTTQYFDRLLKRFQLPVTAVPQEERPYWSNHQWYWAESRDNALAWRGGQGLVVEVARSEYYCFPTWARGPAILKWNPYLKRFLNDWLGSVFHRFELLLPRWSVRLVWGNKLRTEFHQPGTSIVSEDPVLLQFMLDWMRGNDVGPVLDYLQDSTELSHLFR
jgi:hypothetical protein